MYGVVVVIMWSVISFVILGFVRCGLGCVWGGVGVVGRM
jgi:hypothetical protein